MNQPDHLDEEAASQRSMEIPRNATTALDFADQESAKNQSPNTELQKEINQNLIDAEKLRRKLFENAVWLGFMVVVVMYIALCCFVFNMHDEKLNSAWHIATILAIPPTTILFLLIKVLSSNVNNNEKPDGDSTPIGQLISQVQEVVKTWLDKR